MFGGIIPATRHFIAALDRSLGVANGWDPDANSTVRALAIRGTTIYTGGNFTSIGGAQRGYVAALDSTTGASTSWNPNANDIVYAVAPSDPTSSSSVVYASGVFTNIGGQGRNYIAALDAATGSATTWDANPNNVIRAISIVGAKVYAGGHFTNIGGQQRNRVGALDTSSALADAWNPDSDDVIRCLTASGTHVYAGGSFRQISNEVQPYFARVSFASTSVTEPQVISREFVFFQNYPNPFNPHTSISFIIPFSSFVSVSIYDLLGQEIATLMNEVMSSGRHQLTFDGSRLSSGVYFCKLIAGEFSATRKIMIVR